jgi:glutamate/aspartate transport system substrate-binding protein
MLVKTGMADMECGATTNLTSRQKLVSFSNTFFVAEAKVLVKASGSVKTLADLANKRVAAVLGSTGIRLIRQAAFMRGFTVEIIESRNGKVAFEKLAKGEVDAYVGDDAQIELLRTAATQPGDFSFLPEGLSVEPYAIVLPLENDDLRLLVNKTLTAMMSSGELEQLYAKWFMGPVPPTGAVMNMPMSPLMKSVIQFPNDRPATY